jgi:hypothetical protein
MSRARNHETAEALVQAAAGAVAEQYVAVVPTPSFGLVFDAYFSGGAGASEFAPLYEVFRTEDEIHQQPGNALLDPPFKAGHECHALFDYIEEHEARSLADDYFTALRLLLEP